MTNISRGPANLTSIESLIEASKQRDTSDLEWQLRPATVVSYDSGSGVALAYYDEPTSVILPMISFVRRRLQSNDRVFAVRVPPNGNYIISQVPTTDWIDYNTAWTSSGTTPAIGNGTLTSRYVEVAHKTVYVEVGLTWGSTTSAGTGRWFFTPPFDASTDSQNGAVGSAYIFDSGTANRMANVTIAGVTNLFIITSVSNTDVGAGVPQVWATGDQLKFSIIYEVNDSDW